MPADDGQKERLPCIHLILRADENGVTSLGRAVWPDSPRCIHVYTKTHLRQVLSTPPQCHVVALRNIFCKSQQLVCLRNVTNCWIA